VVEDDDAESAFVPANGRSIDWQALATDRQVERLVEFGWPRRYARTLTKGQASVALDSIRAAMEAWAKRREASWRLVFGDDGPLPETPLWHFAPTTDRQLEFLRRLGIDAGELALSRGEASRLIDRLLEERAQQ
jgi:hypothetical protein